MFWVWEARWQGGKELKLEALLNLILTSSEVQGKVSKCA